MFHFFRKKQKNIIAPVAGQCVDITQVPDEAFSSGLMGDGIAVIPKGNVICSPCDGTISMIFPTRHAFGVTMDDGTELLIHIGIDTVILNGVGFYTLKQENAKVCAGDPIIKFDSKYLEHSDMNMTTMVILTNSGFAWQKRNLGNMVDTGDILFEKAENLE